MTIAFSHPYPLDEFSLNFSVTRIISFLGDIPVNKQYRLNKALPSAESQNGAILLPMSHTFDARLMWVKNRKYITAFIVSYDFSEVLSMCALFDITLSLIKP